MGITKLRRVYAVPLFIVAASLVYLAVHFVRQREQAAEDNRIVADINPLIESKLRWLAENDSLLAKCGAFQSWQPEAWGRFSRPLLPPRLFINGVVHFEKTDFGCIVNIVQGPVGLNLQRHPDDEWLKKNPAIHVRTVDRRLEATDDLSEEAAAQLAAGAKPNTAPTKTISYVRFDGEATHPDFVPD